MQLEQTQPNRDDSDMQPLRNEAGEEAMLVVQSPSPDATTADSSLMLFFAVGLVVNIALIAAYFCWAMGQWKKKRSRSTDR